MQKAELLVIGLVLAASGLGQPLRTARGSDAAPLRVGIIGLDTSHAIAFTKILNAPEAPPELENCRVVAAYPPGSPDIANSVKRVPEYTLEIQKYGVEIVDSIEALLMRVDAVLLESNDGRPHLEQLRPVLRAGKPVFVDKPVAGSLADAVAIYEAARRAGVPIFSASALRFGQSTQQARAGQWGRIDFCETHSPAHIEPTHPDLFWYGVHGVESLFTVLGPGCQSVQRSTEDGKIVVTGQWDHGRVGIYREGEGYGGQARGEQGQGPVGAYDGYLPLVKEIAHFFRTGQPPVTPEETLEIYAFMEAADESRRQGGAEVSLASVLHPAGGFEPVFNGRDFQGWTGDLGSYEIQDGLLRCRPGKSGQLFTAREYADFVVRLEFQLPPAGNNGLAIRYPGHGSPHIDGFCELQVLDSEHEQYRDLHPTQYHGSVYGLVAAERGHLRPTGEWNSQEVTVRGSTIRVQLNGHTILDADLSQVTQSKDGPVPPGVGRTRGHFGFTGHSDPVAFRHIYVRELPPAPAVPPLRQPAQRPEERPVILFNGQDLEGFYTWLRDSAYADPKHVFSVRDGHLHISGDGYGGLVTHRAYRDYHLVLEYRWGQRTWGDRTDRARDSGLLVHCWGPDGGYSNTWMASIEAQIIEGGVGDILVLPGRDPVTGQAITSSLVAEIGTDRDGEKIWQKGGQRTLFTSGRINWFGRDEDWVDQRGFRGRRDVDSPHGEWTRLEVIADGDHLVYRVNGIVVNEAWNVTPDAGQILLQTEQAELEVRRLELWPLGSVPAEPPPAAAP